MNFISNHTRKPPFAEPSADGGFYCGNTEIFKNKAVRKRLEYVVLTTNDKKIMQHNSVTIGKATGSLGNDSLERYIIFVAGGKHPIISFANYFRAEHLAIVFARLTNTRMEVFDSNKELCYFVEPTETEQSFIH